MNQLPVTSELSSLAAKLHVHKHSYQAKWHVTPFNGWGWGWVGVRVFVNTVWYKYNFRSFNIVVRKCDKFQTLHLELIILKRLTYHLLQGLLDVILKLEANYIQLLLFLFLAHNLLTSNTWFSDHIRSSDVTKLSLWSLYRYAKSNGLLPLDHSGRRGIVIAFICLSVHPSVR